MERMKRQKDEVTLRPSGLTFTGWRFGLDPGCWIVRKSVAEGICREYGFELPRCGYDRLLDNTRRNYVTNISNAVWMVSLKFETYDAAPTGQWTYAPGLSK